MPTLSEIRTAIRTTIESVTDVGVVHERERFAKREADFRALFEWPNPGGGQIRGWTIRRAAKRESQPAIGRYAVVNRWQIRGYVAFDDEGASELSFDGLVEAVCDAFRADDTLGGVVATTIINEEGISGPQVEDSGPVMFAGVLCHSARLALSTRHYL